MSLIDREKLLEAARRVGQWTPHPDIADRVPFDPESGEYGRATTLARRDVLDLIRDFPAAPPADPLAGLTVERLAEALRKAYITLAEKDNPEDWLSDARFVLAALRATSSEGRCPDCGRTDEHAAPCTNRMLLRATSSEGQER